LACSQSRCIQRQKLAIRQQQVFSPDVMHRRDEIQISLCGYVSSLFCDQTVSRRLFAWTYTTDLTTKGETEFEQWVTTRWQKEHE